MTRWPLLYGPDAALLIMARWAVFAGILLTIYKYGIILIRAHRAGAGVRDTLRVAVRHHEVVFILIIAGYYAKVLLFAGSPARLPVGAFEAAVVDLALAAYWFSVSIPRPGRRRDEDPQRERRRRDRRRRGAK